MTADVTDYSPDRYTGTCFCGSMINAPRSVISEVMGPLGYKVFLAPCGCGHFVQVHHVGVRSAIMHAGNQRAGTAS